MGYYNDPEDVEFLYEPRSRQPGLLTYDMREFLIGQKDLEGPAYTQARQRLRDRIRHGLADFQYIYLIQPRDVELIFDNLQRPPWDNPGLDAAMYRGTTRLFGFLYNGTDQYSPVNFETLLEEGLDFMRVRQSDDGIYRPDATVNVNVNWKLQPDLDAAKERFREGEELEPRELTELLKWGDLDGDDWDELRDRYGPQSEQAGEN